MELQNFLRDLKEYQFNTTDEKIEVALDTIIESVESLIEEIRQDHVQGDVDDQERNG